MSKGSRNRTTNWKAFRENMDRIAASKREVITVSPEAEEEIRKAIEEGEDLAVVVLPDEEDERCGGCGEYWCACDELPKHLRGDGPCES